MHVQPFLGYGSSGGDITTGLIDWYKFNDGSGTLAINSGSNVTQLNIAGGGTATWVAGQVGSGALQFASPKGGYGFSTGNVPDLSGSGTISCWYYKSSSGNASVRQQSWRDSVNSKGIQVVFDNGASTPNINVVSSDGSAFWVTDTTATWNWVSLTYTNGVVGAAYLNNVLMTSTKAAGTFSADSTGGRAYNDKCSFGSAGTGTNIVDDGRRYTRILTATDLATLFAYR